MVLSGTETGNEEQERGNGPPWNGMGNNGQKRGKRWEEKGAGCHGGGWQKWAMAMVGKKEEEEEEKWMRNGTGRPTVEWRAKRGGGGDEAGEKRSERRLAGNWWVMA